MGLKNRNTVKYYTVPISPKKKKESNIGKTGEIKEATIWFIIGFAAVCFLALGIASC